MNGSLALTDPTLQARGSALRFGDRLYRFLGRRLRRFDLGLLRRGLQLEQERFLGLGIQARKALDRCRKPAIGADKPAQADIQGFGDLLSRAQVRLGSSPFVSIDSRRGRLFRNSHTYPQGSLAQAHSLSRLLEAEDEHGVGVCLGHERKTLGSQIMPTHRAG